MNKTEKQIVELLTEIDILKIKLNEANKRISKLEKQNAARRAAIDRADQIEREIVNGCDCYGSID